VRCPKCRVENPANAIYCIRCHAPLRYTCPACKYEQAHGGKCDKCGVDFAKYAAMLVFRAQDDANQRRARRKLHRGMARQILLLPLTGGISLVRYILGWIRGD
jgi:hypothetical protein